MAKCKCSSKKRIVSNVVQSMNSNCGRCRDVCVNPIYGDPKTLGLMAPVIYDEIGINLCATFPLGTDIPTTYPSARNASARVIDLGYSYGAGNVQVSPIPRRVNCYSVTLSNMSVGFAVDLYDDNCNRLVTLFPRATYLPAAGEPTYDEDTNPTSVELEIFAPYGVAFDTTTTPGTPTEIINTTGFAAANNSVKQGINLYARARVLDLDTQASTVTVGVTLILQSLYFAEYRVPSLGKVDVPKGSILPPEESDCMAFVEGDLLELAIKPLSLGFPMHEENKKEECCDNRCGCPVCGETNKCSEENITGQFEDEDIMEP